MEMIAGDIGGTKTTLALFASEDEVKSPVFEATYASGSYRSLEDIIRRFFAEFKIQGVADAIFGVAGPVIGDRAEITNLPWIIEKSRLAGEIGFSAVHLVNDLEAMAYSILYMDEADLFVLNDGISIEKGTKAIIAPGTGLGQAYLTWNGKRYVSHASEGGHTDFGPSNHLEMELLKYLLARYDHVSYELICSGTGVPNLYSFLRDQAGYEEPGWFSEKLAEEADRTALIINTALDREASCDICRATLDMFVSILGAEAGNLALKVLSTGGMYIGGGIPPRIHRELKEGRFMESFLRKGRLSKVLSSMPVSVIMNPKAGLIGTAVAGYEMCKAKG